LIRNFAWAIGVSLALTANTANLPSLLEVPSVFLEAVDISPTIIYPPKIDGELIRAP
jgi:hypothetical protein